MLAFFPQPNSQDWLRLFRSDEGEKYKKRETEGEKRRGGQERKCSLSAGCPHVLSSKYLSSLSSWSSHQRNESTTPCLWWREMRQIRRHAWRACVWTRLSSPPRLSRQTRDRAQGWKPQPSKARSPRRFRDCTLRGCVLPQLFPWEAAVFSEGSTILSASNAGGKVEWLCRPCSFTWKCHLFFARGLSLWTPGTAARTTSPSS